VTSSVPAARTRIPAPSPRWAAPGPAAPRRERITLCGGLLLPVVVLLGIEYRIRWEAFSFTLAELSLPLALISLLGGRRAGLTKLFDSQYIAALIAVLTFGFTSVLVAPDTKHAMSVYRDLVTPCIFFAVLLSIRLSQKDITVLVKAYVVVATINASLGIVQFYSGQFVWFHEPESLVSESWKVSQLQHSPAGLLFGIGNILPVGMYAGVNNFASYLVPPCLIALAFSRMNTPSKMKRFAWMTATAILMLGLVLTFSRASALSLVLGIPLTLRALARARSRVVLTGLVLLTGIAMVIGFLASGVVSWDDLGTGTGRLNMLANGWEFLQSDPLVLLLGGGTLNYMLQFSQVQLVHNLFMYLLLQFGIIVAVAWFVLITTAQVRTFTRLRTGDRNYQQLALALWAGVFVTVFIYGQTTSIADMVQASMWILFLQALAIHSRVAHSQRTPGLKPLLFTWVSVAPAGDERQVEK